MDKMDIQQDALLKELDLRRKEYKTESYGMSIGELRSMYENDEIQINPDFQRLYRWSSKQKSNLIESILLGIPIPSIFVYQREDGIWELVDGLQRVSTILQFMGKLKDYSPLKLEETKYLSQLNNIVWEVKEDNQIEIPDPLKLFIKRSKINLTIILDSSGEDAKYEVFQRLNTGGSIASNQEIRNCSMIMMNKSIYTWFMNLSSNEDFKTTISISQRQENEEYPAELVLRWIGLLFYDYKREIISEFLDEVLSRILKPGFDFDTTKLKFEKTFKILNSILGKQVFKKYSGDDFRGKFLESAFESISVGLGSNIDDYDYTDTDIITEKIKKLWSEGEFIGNYGAGTNASSRIPKIIPFAKKYFKK